MNFANIRITEKLREELGAMDNILSVPVIEFFKIRGIKFFVNTECITGKYVASCYRNGYAVDWSEQNTIQDAINSAHRTCNNVTYKQFIEAIKTDERINGKGEK